MVKILDLLPFTDLTLLMKKYFFVCIVIWTFISISAAKSNTGIQQDHFLFHAMLSFLFIFFTILIDTFMDLDFAFESAQRVQRVGLAFPLSHWGNSHIKFLVIDIKFRFTCDRSNLHDENTVNLHNILSLTIEFKPTCSEKTKETTPDS